MKKNIIFFLLILLISSDTFAGNNPSENKFGIGFQVSYPIWGASFMGNVSKDFSLQGIIGIFGNLNTYGGRLLYHFKHEENYRVYAYGMAGAFNYSSILEDKSETIFGYGAGLGIEFTHDRWFRDSPLWVNFEVGYGNMDFKIVSYSPKAIMVGTGIHYYFND